MASERGTGVDPSRSQSATLQQANTNRTRTAVEDLLANAVADPSN